MSDDVHPPADDVSPWEQAEPETSLESDAAASRRRFRLVWSEDLLAILIGWTLIVVSLGSVALAYLPQEGVDGGTTEAAAVSLLKPWFGKPAGWTFSPWEAFVPSDPEKPAAWAGLLGTLIAGLLLFGFGVRLRGESMTAFARAFLGVFLLAVAAYVLAGQALIKAYNLEYALWALAIGLFIGNTLGTPGWLRPAIRTELFIKTGLVLLGCEILFGRLLSLGVPGIFVAWVVTPIVLITTFWFGQRVLKIESPTLNMVISADMSVCGVSAAIASAAACRAKKEELSLAIGMSLAFTVIMMIVMPAFIRFVEMDEILAGAWIGGTVDATGAVAAAGELVGERALAVAATVKMIQNILIGVFAFFIAVYWVTRVEKSSDRPRPQLSEIWVRFPKFILGFVAASIVFSLMHAYATHGPELVDASISGVTGTFRGWCFCLAFVSIGLETNFQQLSKYLQGGKPLILYVAGQSLNLILTLVMAYLMFKVVFPNAADGLGP